MNMEKFGQFMGESFGKKGLEFLERKVDNFDIEVKGLENIEILKQEACLLVSNHIKPNGKVAESSGISPDAIIISKLVEEETGEKIRIVQKSDDGWWANNSVWRYLQKKVGQPFGRGFSEGIGNVPVQKNPGSSNRAFLESIEAIVSKKGSLLIFPEGHWYPDFDSSHEIKPGAAHIAKKHNLKIIPVYVIGADSWDQDTEVRVFFGTPLNIEGLDKEQISQKIKENINFLQTQNRQFV